MSDIQKNLRSLQTHIQEFEIRHHRTPGSVQLLAVSKKQSIEKILAAVQADQHSFGENYLQEALEKIQQLAAEKIEWHFIGPIQSNKTKKIAENFHWAHTVSSLHIAERLSAQRPSHLPPLNICLQINISNEDTKSGIHPDEALELAKQCQSLSNLHLRGLMAIPAPKNNFAEQRAEFHKLSLLQKKLCDQGIKIDTLSMGMSDDMEAAIAEGSTMLRIGTKIFGRRQET